MNYFLLLQVAPDSIIVVFGGAVITGLTGAVGVLFKMFAQEKERNRADYELCRNDLVQCRLDLVECRNDREQLHFKLHELSIEVGKLRGIAES